MNNTIVNSKFFSEWDYSYNEKINLCPEKLTTGSSKKVGWICSLGHKWVSSPDNRFRGKGRKCPYCSGRKILVGFNDLATKNPKLAKEWNYSKNNILPTEVSVGSHKKVWWKCEIGHMWQARIVDRAHGSKCIFCANQAVLAGYNDLFTTNPELYKEFSKRNDITPYEILASSGKKVWWECSLGHEWEARANNRKQGQGCPYCVNQKVLTGYNDLETIFPRLTLEWDYEKNNLLPDEITAYSNRYAWWICENNHSWRSRVSNRASGSGCPDCSYKVSKQEKELRYFVDSIIDEKILSNNRTIISPYELDIYIPDLKIAIEYNGEYWHSDKIIQEKHGVSAEYYHQIKFNKCKEVGIRLLFVWENEWNSKKDDVKIALQKYFEHRKHSSLLTRLE